MLSTMLFHTLFFPASSIYLIRFPVTESNWKEEKSSRSVFSWRAVLSLSLNSLQLGCQSLLIFPKNFILAQSLWKAPVTRQWWEEEAPAALRALSVPLKTFEAMVVMQVSISATQSTEIKATFSVQAELLVHFGVWIWLNNIHLRGLRLTALRELLLKVVLLIRRKWVICINCNICELATLDCEA